MKVLYVSSNGGIHDYRFLKKLSEEYEVLFLHYAADEIINEIDMLQNLQIISKKPAFKSLPLLSEINHFKKIVKEFNPDIIHSGYVWQVGILAAKSGFHPHLSMPWGSDILTEPDKSYIKRSFVRKVLKTCDHVQCDAEFVKKKIMDDYGIREDMITVFPWGIDLTLFKKLDKQTSRNQLKLNKEKFIVLFNRYLEGIYGVKYLLEAFNIFAAGKTDVQLLMLSEGSGKTDILKYITEKGLEDKISVIGRVPNHELPVFLNSADVYISTSLSDGTSLSLLEAMACGCGIIATDVPAILEWISNENGFIVPKANSAAPSKALNEYYANRNLIENHSNKNSKITMERADWNINFLKLKDIYTKLLK